MCIRDRFNMVALWFFGPVVEERFGHLRFLLYYLCLSLIHI